ncbi:MAG: RNA-guided endonuclease IscB [Oscillospiraceae bacterium]|nr:RNA-guided endonuclease IscB [Oscillospiraceae bacterium]
MSSVYVINKHGRPLMPCSPAKARHLLKDGRAKVKKRTPFTIQLLYGSTGYTQPVVLGVDAGSKTIGLSACTEDKELFAAEVTPRIDVTAKMSTRREFRRARRNRKTRHRQPRFNNRVHSKHKGWLAPSVEVKIQEHITAIKRVCEILPVSKVVVETAEFDLQMLKAVEDGLPVPEGENYQKGEMYGHYNVRQFVLWRDGYTCQCCGAHGDGVKLHAHHLESRKTGGNAPDDRITLCDVCHGKVHKGLITDDKFKRRKRKSTRDAAFMGIMRKTLMARLNTELDIPVVETKGYITKATRVERLHLPKTKTSDALAIAQGRQGFGIQAYVNVARADRVYHIQPVRHHNRQLHRATIQKGGVRRNNQAPTYVKGFRLFDKVLYQGIECFIWGRRVTGFFTIKTIDGQMIKDGVSYKKIKLLERASNYLIA